MSQSEELERLPLLGDGETSSLPEAPSQQRDSELPASSAAFATDDFLYHLYRGSELLQESRVGEAKEELERALALQPLDIEGQGLLGVVYFRLGLYPRAIAIYSEIVRARPQEVTPRLNLGLCYFKTGQLLLARDVLAELVEQAPDHRRAWGYLGLVYERLGEVDRAATAFEHAGQANMARRMRERLDALTRLEEPARPDLGLVRAVAAEAAAELDTHEPRFARDHDGGPGGAPSGRWLPVELGEEAMPASGRGRGARAPLVADLADVPKTAPTPLAPPPATSAVSPRELGERLRLSQLGGARIARRGEKTALLRLDGELAVRPGRVHAYVPEGEPFSTRPLVRRTRQRELGELLGGNRAPLRELVGRGLVLLAGSPRLLLLELGRELFYVREDRLVGFDLSLAYESGRLSIGTVEHLQMVQLSGAGLAAIEASDALAAVDVSSSSVLVRGADVLGWVGRLAAQALPPGGDLGPGLVSFSGEGAVFVDPS